MNLRQLLTLSMVSTLLVFVSLFNTGCEGDSAETAVRNVEIVVSGLYRGNLNEGDKLVSQNSGNTISSIDLRQDGDHIEGVDNNGLIFKGTLGQVGEASASFTLRGRTTAGADATIVGTIEVGSIATMTGSWAEPSLFGTVSGSAAPAEQGSPSNDTVSVVSELISV